MKSVFCLPYVCRAIIKTVIYYWNEPQKYYDPASHPGTKGQISILFMVLSSDMSQARQRGPLILEGQTPPINLLEV